MNALRWIRRIGGWVVSGALVAVSVTGCTGDQAVTSPKPSPSEATTSLGPSSSAGGTGTATSSAPAEESFKPETAHEIRNCPALRRVSRKPKVVNPCAKAREIVTLLATRRHEFNAEHGFHVFAAVMSPQGLLMVVKGDLTAARDLLADDPLIYRMSRSGHIFG